MLRAQTASPRRSCSVQGLSQICPGTGMLKPGDFALYDGIRFSFERIQVFQENPERVQPPRNVGLVLGTQVNKDLFRERQELRFQR
jgi:hypothetical protein